jgi:hypothetical protein
MLESWGENNDWGVCQTNHKVQMSSTCGCQLPTEQGELAVTAQIQDHQFPTESTMAPEVGARGDCAPTIGADVPANDTHRTSSANHDSIHAMGLEPSG